MLSDDIAAALSELGGLSLAELAARLARDDRAVSFALLAGHHRFRCDRGSPPRWWLVQPGGYGALRPFGDDADDTVPRGSRQLFADQVSGSTAELPSLYRWQVDALKAWEARGCRGVVEAVTGTGKTRVGVVAALEEIGRRGQVLILVPTVELQHQWVVELGSHLPDSVRVGRMGAGSADRLMTHDVLVAVVNSARALDVRPIRRGGLLIADECHRYGSAVNRLALDPRFARRLGLSATYARDDDGNLSWLDPYFGGTCFRFSYARAVAEGVTAHFSATLIGVRFTVEERGRYDELTEIMGRARARLVTAYDLPQEPFEAFLRAVMALADSGETGSSTARTYRQAMLERRRLLADTPSKEEVLARIAPALAAADRSIVFTRSIAGSERAAALLALQGLRAGVVHSAMSPAERRVSLARFAAGELQVLAAPRVLDEGIDVPAADLAVIVGASRSRRQMIQRMGRILRRKPDGRRARFAVLYVEGTVEDPRCGAHEAFLNEITDVAEETRCFSASMANDATRSLLEALQPVIATVRVP